MLSLQGTQSSRKARDAHKSSLHLGDFRAAQAKHEGRQYGGDVQGRAGNGLDKCGGQDGGHFSLQQPLQRQLGGYPWESGATLWGTRPAACVEVKVRVQKKRTKGRWRPGRRALGSGWSEMAIKPPKPQARGPTGGQLTERLHSAKIHRHQVQVQTWVLFSSSNCRKAV